MLLPLCLGVWERDWDSFGCSDLHAGQKKKRMRINRFGNKTETFLQNYLLQKKTKFILFPKPFPFFSLPQSNKVQGLVLCQYEN